jgi:hypothetical protein
VRCVVAHVRSSAFCQVQGADHLAGVFEAVSFRASSRASSHKRLTDSWAHARETLQGGFFVKLYLAVGPWADRREWERKQE